MKTKALLVAAMMLCGVSVANAQYVAGYGGKHNSVKADFNCGWFISKFEDRYGNSHRGIFGTGFSVSYEHVFKPGVGFGLNYIMENGNEDDIKTQFIGPSAVYAGSFGSWTFSYSVGLGLGKINYDSYRMGHYDDNGFGYYAQVEAQKRFSDHFGIAAGIRVLDITTSVSDDGDMTGTGSFRFTIGPRFYF